MRKIFENKFLCLLFKILKSIMMILVIMMLLLVLVQRLSNNNLSIGGYRAFTIISESMLPVYEIGDVVIAKEKSSKEINVGDDLVYLGNEGDFKDKVIAHRIINLYDKNGTYFFQTKGVNNEIIDPLVSQEQVYGVVVYKTLVFSILGKIMSSNLGYYLLFTLIAVLISFQLIGLFLKKSDDEDEKA